MMHRRFEEHNVLVLMLVCPVTQDKGPGHSELQFPTYNENHREDTLKIASFCGGCDVGRAIKGIPSAQRILIWKLKKSGECQVYQSRLARLCCGTKFTLESLDLNMQSLSSHTSKMHLGICSPCSHSGVLAVSILLLHHWIYAGEKQRAQEGSTPAHKLVTTQNDTVSSVHTPLTST